jgi:hypothetical protein
MRNQTMRNRESGVVILALFVLIILGVVIGAFLFVKRQHDHKTVSTTAAEVVEAGGSALSRNAQNVQRKQDASNLLGATAEYVYNNSGQIPTRLTSEMLQGMGYYTSASLVEGEQDTVATDEMRLVTSARCLANGATAAGETRQYAVQFSTKNDDNSFTPECKDG